MADDWQVGDLAVCVDAGWRDINGFPTDANGLLSHGQVYDVRGLKTRTNGRWRGVPCLLLDLGVGRLRSFATERFRKIRPDEQSGDIDTWQLILDTHTKQKERAR